MRRTSSHSVFVNKPYKCCVNCTGNIGSQDPRLTGGLNISAERDDDTFRQWDGELLQSPLQSLHSIPAFYSFHLLDVV